MKTRDEIADELLEGCPDTEPDADGRTEQSDHETVAEAIRSGQSWEQIEQMEELNSWPESYIWVKRELSEIDD